MKSCHTIFLSSPIMTSLKPYSLVNCNLPSKQHLTKFIILSLEAIFLCSFSKSVDYSLTPLSSGFCPFPGFIFLPTFAQNIIVPRLSSLTFPFYTQCYQFYPVSYNKCHLCIDFSHVYSLKPQIFIFLLDCLVDMEKLKFFQMQVLDFFPKIYSSCFGEVTSILRVAQTKNSEVLGGGSLFLSYPKINPSENPIRFVKKCI